MKLDLLDGSREPDRRRAAPDPTQGDVRTKRASLGRNPEACEGGLDGLVNPEQRRRARYPQPENACPPAAWKRARSSEFNHVGRDSDQGRGEDRRDLTDAIYRCLTQKAQGEVELLDRRPPNTLDSTQRLGLLLDSGPEVHGESDADEQSRPALRLRISSFSACHALEPPAELKQQR